MICNELILKFTTGVLVSSCFYFFFNGEATIDDKPKKPFKKAPEGCDPPVPWVNKNPFTDYVTIEEKQRIVGLEKILHNEELQLDELDNQKIKSNTD
jgi:hypothetical protein